MDVDLRVVRVRVRVRARVRIRVGMRGSIVWTSTCGWRGARSVRSASGRLAIQAMGHTGGRPYRRTAIQAMGHTGDGPYRRWAIQADGRSRPPGVFEESPTRTSAMVRPSQAMPAASSPHDMRPLREELQAWKTSWVPSWRPSNSRPTRHTVAECTSRWYSSSTLKERGRGFGLGEGLGWARVWAGRGQG